MNQTPPPPGGAGTPQPQQQQQPQLLQQQQPLLAALGTSSASTAQQIVLGTDEKLYLLSYPLPVQPGVLPLPSITPLPQFQLQGLVMPPSNSSGDGGGNANPNMIQSLANQIQMAIAANAQHLQQQQQLASSGLLGLLQQQQQQQQSAWMPSMSMPTNTNSNPAQNPAPAPQMQQQSPQVQPSVPQQQQPQATSQNASGNQGGSTSGTTTNPFQQAGTSTPAQGVLGMLPALLQQHPNAINLAAAAQNPFLFGNNPQATAAAPPQQAPLTFPQGSLALFQNLASMVQPAGQQQQQPAMNNPFLALGTGDPNNQMTAENLPANLASLLAANSNIGGNPNMAQQQALALAQLQQQALSNQSNLNMMGANNLFPQLATNAAPGSNVATAATTNPSAAAAPEPQVKTDEATEQQQDEYDDDSGVIVPGRPPVLLYLSNDDQALSEYQCLLRKQIQLFQATRRDLSTTQGRNRPIQLGQVGVRCRHCTHLPASSRKSGSVYFPSKLVGIYQTAQNLATGHLIDRCPFVPPMIKVRLHELKDKKSFLAGGRKYWSDGAKVLGVYESVEERLLRFRPRGNNADKFDASDKKAGDVTTEQAPLAASPRTAPTRSSRGGTSENGTESNASFPGASDDDDDVVDDEEEDDDDDDDEVDSNYSDDNPANATEV